MNQIYPKFIWVEVLNHWLNENSQYKAQSELSIVYKSLPEKRYITTVEFTFL